MRLSAIVLILSTGLLVPLFGVMFASDSVQLAEDGVNITDNSVVMTDSRDPEKLEGVVKGVFRTKQAPGPLTFVFSKMSSPVMNRKEWRVSDKGDKKTYEDYMKALVPVYSVVIGLPDPSDKSASGSPDSGMTGGTIGKTRYFTVDLKTKKVTQKVPPEETSAQVPSESEESEKRGVNGGLIIMAAAVVILGGALARKLRRKKGKE